MEFSLSGNTVGMLRVASGCVAAKVRVGCCVASVYTRVLNCQCEPGLSLSDLDKAWEALVLSMIGGSLDFDDGTVTGLRVVDKVGSGGLCRGSLACVLSCD